MSQARSQCCPSWAQPCVEVLQVYQTAKVVQLKDYRLGWVYYGLLLLIALFVVGYEILYSNDHFDKRDVTGTPFVSIQQPTVDGCTPGKEGCLSDYTPLVDLPYCDVYSGNSTSVLPENRHPCIFADKHTLEPPGSLDGSIFVPTRIDVSSEVRACMPSPSNGYSCPNEFRTVNSSGVRFVADIERFTLLIAHTYHRDTISGNNNLLQGSYLECNQQDTSGALTALKEAIFGAEECPGGYVRKQIPCIQGGGCGERSNRVSLVHRGGRRGRRSAARRAALLGAAPEADASDGPPAASPGNAGNDPPTPDVYAISDGDVFSVGKLLSLAGASLDDTMNLDGDPLREAGTVLDIQVNYNNLYAFSSTFGNTGVEYWYKVNVRPMHQVKEEVVAWTAEDGSRRVIEDRHGIAVILQVQGTFGFFSIMNFLLMLTTAAALLTIATVLTDKLAIYALPDRDFYSQQKYQVASPEAAAEEEEAQAPGGGSSRRPQGV